MNRTRPRQFLVWNLVIVLGCLLLVSAIFFAAGQRLASEGEYRLGNVRTSNANLVLGLEAHTRGLFANVGFALAFARHQYLQGGHLDLEELIEEGGLDRRIVTAIRVLDDKGKVVDTVGAETDNAPRDRYFAVIPRDGEDETFIGKPRLVARADDPAKGDWVIDIGRPVHRRDGTYAGLVTAVADLGRLASFYRQTKLGGNDMMMLVFPDGTGLLRLDGPGAMTVGKDMRGSTLIEEFSKNPAQGSYVSKGRRSGVEYQMSYRKVGDLPLIVALGTSRDEAFAEIEKDAVMHYSVASLASLALVILALVLIRALARQREFMATLIRNEARFRATFGQAFVGMAQATPDGTPLQVNRTLCAILGRPEQEVLSLPLDDFIHPDDRADCAADGPAERRLVRKDGSVAWVSMATTRVIDEQDRTDCLVSVVQDISEFKRIDRMKSEFVSMVSHELRTPLTSIRGSLGLLAGGVAGALPGPAKNLVEIATTNCERLIRLINDILDTEKIESGKMRFEFADLDLADLLREAVAANQGLARHHGVSFALTLPEGPVVVSADRDRLDQVVSNLLSNAAKFAPAGSEVTIALRREEDARARVEVHDRGPGIPDEFRARIFQKFSQADSSDTRQKGGSGLGLNISKAIIERLGGTIGFTTEAGAGTTFHFELPEAAPAPAPRAEGPMRPCVLVCEDDRDIARVIAMMLANAGYDSDIASSAAQARDHLATRSYDAMTVDLRLPDEDGVALIQDLRRWERTAALPLIVVSAAAEEGRLRINGQTRAVSEWLSKPIDESRLVNAVRHATSGARYALPNVLHVENDPDVQCIVAAVAQDLASFRFATGLREARERLRERAFDLVVLDLELGDGTGWELLDDLAALQPAAKVVVFSMNPVDPADAARVDAVVTKAHASNENIRATLRRVLESTRVGAVVE